MSSMCHRIEAIRKLDAIYVELCVGRCTVKADEIRREIAQFQTPSNAWATFEFVATIIPLFCGWALAFAFAKSNSLLLFAVIPFTSIFVVRAFLIQHDCGHYAFFRGRLLNDLAGRFIGVLSLTPYEYWRRAHALHHAHAGNIGHRGFWDVPMLTVAEFKVLGPARQLGYRMLRHPLILFGIVPFYIFVIQHRLPVGLMRQGWKPWASALGTNLALGLIIWCLIRTFGWQVTSIAMLPILAIAASIGVWLFFVQHYFEGSQYRPAQDWRFAEAALQASSNYVLPQPWRWLTANVGMHHIHHLNSRIPCYRLPEALQACSVLATISRVPLRSGGFCISRTLWDESRRTFVSPLEAAHTARVGGDGSPVN